MVEYTVDLEGLKELAKKLARKLKGNEVIFLKGDLGAGKTTFTKFLVKALEPVEDIPVRSPTFAVMNVYPTKKGEVFHLDLYRVKTFDVTDYLDSGILVVEWPEYLRDVEPDIVVELEHLDENTRKVRIKGISL
jgi:tRNA threonylcarbamoyladenosine biosynthesis protein TsaE